MGYEFKVGDRVRLTGEDWVRALYGRVATIDRIGYVNWLDEFVPSFTVDGKTYYIYSYGRNDYSAELVESADPSPKNYYVFPGGVQVRDISAHLTSFGGQALQYVARATRLDGQNKGDRVEDLRKAIDFLNWEIERIESEDR